MPEYRTQIDNEIPVEVYSYPSNEKIGEYPSVRKAFNGLGITRSGYTIWHWISKKKNGEPRTMQCDRLNTKIYFKLWKTKLKVGDEVIVTKQHSSNWGLGEKGVLTRIEKGSKVPYLVKFDKETYAIWHVEVKLVNNEVEIQL